MDPSVSVHLALLLIADRLADERSLDVEAEMGPRARRNSLRLGLGRAFQSCSLANPLKASAAVSTVA